MEKTCALKKIVIKLIIAQILKKKKLKKLFLFILMHSKIKK